MVRELIAVQNFEQIERICKILSENFVLSQNGNFRRGGLIGIAALAIACGKVSLIYSLQWIFFLYLGSTKI
jgi:vacuole morphology and inheritance protein 14